MPNPGEVTASTGITGIRTPRNRVQLAAGDQIPPHRGTAAGFRADIQGLRAFAVVVVILDHLVRWPSGGFVGVDVFFVISGYLITSHILRELNRTGRLSFAGFYRRRIRRIVPAATLVILVTVIASALVLPRGRALSTMVDGVWAFLFGANWRSMSVRTDYFQLGQLPSPLQHYWSLSVEEQFYFVWPLLTAVVFVIASRTWRTSGAASRAVAATFGVLVAASFVWAVVETATEPTAAYFSTFARAWELGVGALLAAVSLGRWRIPAAARIALAWLGIAGLVVSVFWIDASSLFPAPTAALPVLSTAAVIAAGIEQTGPGYARALWPLTNPVSRYLGAISYSLYLWHFPVIVLLAAFVPTESRRYVMFALTLTAVLSVLSYHYVEEPVRRSGWLSRRPLAVRPARRRTLVVLSLGAIALTVGATIGAVRLAVDPAASNAMTPPSGACVGAHGAPGAGGVCAPEGEIGIGRVAPALDELPTDTAGGYSCWRPKGGELQTCTFGSDSPDALRVALVGDSHAAALLPAFLDRAGELNWSLDSYVGFGCQWMDQPSGSDCDAVADQVQERLLGGDYDLVITTAARWAVADVDADAFRARWNDVAATGPAVVVVASVPTVPETVFTCLARVGMDVAACGTPIADALEPADPLLAAADGSDVAVVDMTDFYCDDSTCPAVIGGVIVYRDAAGHISGTYMKTMAPYLVERIQAAVSAR